MCVASIDINFSPQILSDAVTTDASGKSWEWYNKTDLIADVGILKEDDKDIIEAEGGSPIVSTLLNVNYICQSLPRIKEAHS